jgi:hypothetical protein
MIAWSKPRAVWALTHDQLLLLLRRRLRRLPLLRRLLGHHGHLRARASAHAKQTLLVLRLLAYERKMGQ